MRLNYQDKNKRRDILKSY